MNFEQAVIREFLDSLAAKTPTPGGGSVASITAALAAALGQMVLNYSIGKKSLAAHDATNRQAIETLQRLGHEAIELAEADARAYGQLNELWKLKQDDPRRMREFPGAVDAAIAAPRAVMDCSLHMLDLMLKMPETTNAMLKSDLAIAAILADAAVRAAAWNVRINLSLLTDQSQRMDTQASMASQLAQSHEACALIEKACAVPMD